MEVKWFKGLVLLGSFSEIFDGTISEFEKVIVDLETPRENVAIEYIWWVTIKKQNYINRSNRKADVILLSKFEARTVR